MECGGEASALNATIEEKEMSNSIVRFSEATLPCQVRRVTASVRIVFSLSLLLSQAGWMEMAPKPYVAPVVDSTVVFKDDIFKGKVLFCTGGGSGICRGMTETVV